MVLSGKLNTLCDEFGDVYIVFKLNENDDFAQELGRLAIANFLFGNADFHLGNGLICQNTDTNEKKIIPIDFGFALVNMKNLNDALATNFGTLCNTESLISMIKESNPNAFEAASKEIHKTYNEKKTEIKLMIKKHL